MIESPTTVAAVMDMLAKRKLLGEVGMSDSHARTIKTRGRIPGHWHQSIVNVAQRHALPINYELLARLAVRKQPEPAQ